MESKQAAKLAFGNPGFFDFLAPITKPLVAASTAVTGSIHSALGLPTAQAFAKPEVQALGQELAGAGIIAGGAIAGGAIAAPLLAGVSLPSLGGIFGSLNAGASQIGNFIQDNISDSGILDDDASDDTGPVDDEEEV